MSILLASIQITSPHTHKRIGANYRIALKPSPIEAQSDAAARPSTARPAASSNTATRPFAFSRKSSRTFPCRGQDARTAARPKRIPRRKRSPPWSSKHLNAATATRFSTRNTPPRCCGPNAPTAEAERIRTRPPTYPTPPRRNRARSTAPRQRNRALPAGQGGVGFPERPAAVFHVEGETRKRPTQQAPAGKETSYMKSRAKP